jgi:hypothetical protein
LDFATGQDLYLWLTLFHQVFAAEPWPSLLTLATEFLKDGPLIATYLVAKTEIIEIPSVLVISAAFNFKAQKAE